QPQGKDVGEGMPSIREQCQRMGEESTADLRCYNEQRQEKGESQGLLCHAVGVIMRSQRRAHYGFLQLPRGASAIVRTDGCSKPAPSQQSSFPHPHVSVSLSCSEEKMRGVMATGATALLVERR